MTKGIFEGAKFGDKFVTRDGRVAIYWRRNVTQYVLITEDGNALYCDENGSDVDNYDDDIVSRYQESVNEEKLDELVHKHIDEWGDTLPKTTMAWADGFKVGYRKAKEE